MSRLIKSYEVNDGEETIEVTPESVNMLPKMSYLIRTIENSDAYIEEKFSSDTIQFSIYSDDKEKTVCLSTENKYALKNYAEIEFFDKAMESLKDTDRSFGEIEYVRNELSELSKDYVLELFEQCKKIAVGLKLHAPVAIYSGALLIDVGDDIEFDMKSILLKNTRKNIDLNNVDLPQIFVHSKGTTIRIARVNSKLTEDGYSITGTIEIVNDREARDAANLYGAMTTMSEEEYNSYVLDMIESKNKKKAVLFDDIDLL